MKRNQARTLQWARRLSQAFFLCLFVWFLVRTSYYAGSIDPAAAKLTAPRLVNYFFYFDPFAALTLLLSTGTAVPLFLLSLITVAATIALGRFFCGWICPFGTLHHAAGIAGSRLGWSRRLPESSLSVKYVLLAALLVVSAFSLLQASIFDPLAILSRSLIFVVFPLSHAGVVRVLAAAFRSDIAFVQPAAEWLYARVSTPEIAGAGVAYRWAGLTGLVFAALLGVNLVYPRFWCRALCPLGALLALAARLSPLAMLRSESACVECGLCMNYCQGGIAEENAARLSPPDCMLCLNCQAVCPANALGFRCFGLRDEPELSRSRRALLGSIAAGVAAGAIGAPLLRPGRRRNRPRLIRPPGALPEKEFLSTCIRCGACSRICPTGVIQTSVAEAGVEGIWTPLLVPRIGYCIYSCTLCGQVCPSQAIRSLTLEEKMGTPELEPVKLGTAVVDRARCIPWSLGVPCAVCEEVCPVSPKAIGLDVIPGGENGYAGRLRGPVVRPLRCIGCGRCEYICPVEGRAAIRVYAVGERRASG